MVESVLSRSLRTKRVTVGGRALLESCVDVGCAALQRASGRRHDSCGRQQQVGNGSGELHFDEECNLGSIVGILLKGWIGRQGTNRLGQDNTENGMSLYYIDLATLGHFHL